MKGVEAWMPNQIISPSTVHFDTIGIGIYGKCSGIAVAQGTGPDSRPVSTPPDRFPGTDYGVERLPNGMTDMRLVTERAVRAARSGRWTGVDE